MLRIFQWRCVRERAMGNALSNSSGRRSNPQPRNRAGVCAVSAADEDAFRAAVSATRLRSFRATARDGSAGDARLWSARRYRNARREISRRDRRRRRHRRGRRGQRDQCAALSRAPGDVRSGGIRITFLPSSVWQLSIGLTERTGFGGACADDAMFIAPACFSGVERSGAVESWTARDAGVLGRMAANCSLEVDLQLRLFGPAGSRRKLHNIGKRRQDL